MWPEGKVLYMSHPTNLANHKLAYSLSNIAPERCDAIEGKLECHRHHEPAAVFDTLGERTGRTSKSKHIFCSLLPSNTLNGSLQE